MLESFVVAHIVRHFFTGTFVLADVSDIEADLRAEIFVQFGDTILPIPQIINNKAKVRVDFIELPQLFVHLVSLFLELNNFGFTRLNITLELLNFVIEDELEFLQLLSLLLEKVDSLLSHSDQLIFLIYALVVLVNLGV